MPFDLREPLERIVRGNMTPFVRRSGAYTVPYSYTIRTVY